MLRETSGIGSYITEGFESIAPPAFAKLVANELAKFTKHIFLAPTRHPDYFLEVEEFLGGWPSNFWPGLLVETFDQLGQIWPFNRIDSKHKWLSLLLPQSDPARSLSQIWYKAQYEIPRFDLVVGGGMSPSDRGISAEDEIFIAKTAHESGCCFYSSSGAIREAFLAGDTVAFDRILCEHSDIGPEGKLKAIRTMHQLPPELGGPPEGAYCVSDRKVWADICPPWF